MNMKYLVLVALLVMACKPDSGSVKKNELTGQELTKEDTESLSKIDKPVVEEDPFDTEATKKLSEGITSPCELISVKEIAKIFGIEENAVTIKDASTAKSPHSKSCFFRWDDGNYPIPGFLIQVQANPLSEEFPNWPSVFIQSKIDSGDQTFDGSGVVYKYKPFSGIGDIGAYCYEASRFHWTKGDDYVFMLAFNVEADEEKQLSYAKEIGTKVMANFK